MRKLLRRWLGIEDFETRHQAGVDFLEQRILDVQMEASDCLTDYSLRLGALEDKLLTKRGKK